MKNLFKGKKAFLTIPFAVLIALSIIGSVAGSNPSSKGQPAQITKTPESKVEGVKTQTIESITAPVVQSWPEAKVIKVVDGDTLSVSLNGKTETIRVIGIDTPETVDPRKPVQCFGQKASDMAKEQLLNQTVQIESDPIQGERDKYNRLLRYVWLDDGSSDFGAIMIQFGYAYEYTYSLPYKYQEKYKKLQKEAEQSKKGLWADNACPIAPTKTTSNINTGTQTTSDSTYSGGDKDCGDFSTHAEAQSFFISQGGPGSDPHKLDADHDGEACETLP